MKKLINRFETAVRLHEMKGMYSENRYHYESIINEYNKSKADLLLAIETLETKLDQLRTENELLHYDLKENT